MGQWTVIINKFIILILADLLMHWSDGRWLGLDFLGFIALSSLVMEFIRRSSSPLTYSLIGLVLISLLRYLLGPLISSIGNEPQTWGILNWILGTKDTPGVSYPLSPWMAYPFAGYIIGVAAMRYRGFIETHRWRVVSGLLMLGGLNSVAGLILLQRGASFFRWGTVGIGFYVVSFAVISISLAGVLAICGEPRLKVGQDTLSLRGIASLAVVPVHYFLIYLVTMAGGTGMDFLKYSLIAIAVLTASFFLARSVENLSQIIRQVKKQKVVWFGLAAMFVLAAGLTLFYSQESKDLALFTRTFGQIVLCLLFVVRLPL
ncbi:hypothetical protein Mic7113_6568 (plasmid) [Allocoleopsis franciscana PCC 7113]|uniref:Uncharacterized protein n=2 Tax=Allocoleopsis TaxID=2886347 RepID=K9WRH3_9CYAN|nr:hypothetical protein Mic7113_6568 [Allocoleopsis franciscana PCC 7113]